MIIDCHGHYTTEPSQFIEWREAQLRLVEEGSYSPTRDDLTISNEEIRESIEEDVLGRGFKQPPEGLGNVNIPASHMWRTLRRPSNAL